VENAAEVFFFGFFCSSGPNAAKINLPGDMPQL